MLVPLANTLNPLRAHMAAGVLEEHGIPAWVWGDLSSSNCGPVTTGGCSLMVDDEDAAEAAAVLNAMAPAPEEAGEPPPPRVPVSPGEAIGTGLIQGAMHLPFLMVLWLFLQMVLYALGRILFPKNALEELLPVSVDSVAGQGIAGVIGGAVLGALAGWVTWLLGDYKRGGWCGTVFVGLVTTLILLPELPLILIVLLSRAFGGVPEFTPEGW